LALSDGTMLDKAESKAALAQQLRQLAGKTHELYSAAVIAEAGQPVWRHVERVRLTMRPMSDAFIASYIDQDWDEVQYCVGGYRIEGPGVQLFSTIDGSHFAILGLPLLPLLAWLRQRGYLVS
jgi:septum formation protein